MSIQMTTEQIELIAVEAAIGASIKEAERTRETDAVIKSLADIICEKNDCELRRMLRLGACCPAALSVFLNELCPEIAKVALTESDIRRLVVDGIEQDCFRQSGVNRVEDLPLEDQNYLKNMRRHDTMFTDREINKASQIFCISITDSFHVFFN